MSETVVFCANTFWSVHQFRSGVVNELLRLGLRVVVLAPPDDSSAQLRDMGCETIEVPLSARGINPVEDLRLLMRLRTIYRSLKPDCVFHFTIKPNVYGNLAARMEGVRSICMVTGLGYAFLTRGLASNAGRLLYRLSCRFADQVWFLNRDDRTEFLRRGLVRENKVDLIPGEGVDTVHFHPAPRRLGSDDFVFLLIARVLWDKGVGEYVHAARALRRKYPWARFQLLGQLGARNRSSVDQATFQAWVGEGAIEYLGTATDVRPYLAACDCAVLPSYREGLPRSLLEAAAMRLPLVATDVPGCREVVRDGVNGFLCTPRDPESLQMAMKKMLELSPHEQARFGKSSREIVEREFDEKLVIRRYLDVLQSYGIPERRKVARRMPAWRAMRTSAGR